MSKKKDQAAKLDQAKHLVLTMGVYHAIRDEEDTNKVAEAIGLALLVWGAKHGVAPEDMAAEWARQAAKAMKAQ
jgi:hypothetical protein